jgi:hypothetical protein
MEVSMFRKSKHRPLNPTQLARIADRDLGAVVGGMFGQPMGSRSAGPVPPPIKFPPLPPIPQQASFRVAMPPPPSPFSVSTFSTGGTGQSPQHVISASFDNGRMFANGTVFTPAVPAIPPLPSITGNATPALQTHQVNAGFHFNF